MALRLNRFVGDGDELSFPDHATNIPKCLQPGFRPSKTVAMECYEHGFRSIDGGDERVTALQTYTGDDLYDSLNASLRQYNHKQWENTTYHLNMAIVSFLHHPRGRHPYLWRGLRGKAKLRVGSTVVFKQFVSATRSPDVARAFAGYSGIVLEFRSWKIGADVAHFSPYAEAEVLLAPYQLFRVEAIEGNKVILQAL